MLNPENDNRLIIKVYSHNFSVHSRKYGHYQVVTDFSKKFIKYGYQYDRFKKRKVPVALCVFAAATKDRKSIRYHINVFNSFLFHLKKYGLIENKDFYIEKYYPEDIEWDTVNLNLADGWKPRENQLNAINYVLDPNKNKRIKLVTLGTGMGKTFISLYTAVQKKIRFVLLVRPQYINRWIDGVIQSYDINKNEILVINGSESLKQAFRLKENNLLDNVKVIIISSKTFQLYITKYELEGERILDEENGGWPILPYQYAETLGAKWVYVDESHQDFHLNFKITLYTHCERMVSSTATLMPDDHFLSKMAELAFPYDERLPTTEAKKYIVAYGFRYSLSSPIRFKSCNKRMGYSHIAFEKIVMRNRTIKLNYYNLILKAIKIGYLNRRKVGNKCLIFVSTVKMATDLTKFLTEKIPELNIKRYVSEDPVENLMHSDIRISTLNSAGTAIDIDGLSCSILTMALNGTQANIQVLGRLRELKDNTTPIFIWFTCNNLKKHLIYHDKKINEIFKNRLLNYQDINTGVVI